MTTKRFVIRKSLIGKNEVITFTNKKGEQVKYNHDEVYNTHKDRFESMNCFQKYKSSFATAPNRITRLSLKAKASCHRPPKI